MTKVEDIEEVEHFFRDFASRHSLNISKDDQDSIEFIMTVPVQNRLSFELTLGLQNSDEINIGFKEFWSYIFPFKEQKKHLNQILDGLITGHTRLATYRQIGRIISRDLEVYENENWTRVYRQCCGTKLPFFQKTVSYFQNESKYSNP